MCLLGIRGSVSGDTERHIQPKMPLCTKVIARDIRGQPCTLLRFVEGSDSVVEYDFLHVREDAPNMPFMGAKLVDGAGFYYPENQPSVGLQQPLVRVK